MPPESILRRLGLGSWISDLTDLLLPTGCVSCATWVPRAEGPGPSDLVCAVCRARMRPGSWPRCARCHWPRGTGRAEASECRACAAWPSSLTAARFAYELAPPVDDLVHGLKYAGWRELAPFMGAAIARLEPTFPSGGSFEARGPGSTDLSVKPGMSRPNTVVVPVPTTTARSRARGYNQAALLADEVAIRLGLPVLHALRRGASETSQTALTPEERRRNVRGAFEITSEARNLLGRHVLLVDDVLTTGATVAEASERLVEAGADSVVAATFARAVGAGAPTST